MLRARIGLSIIAVVCLLGATPAGTGAFRIGSGRLPTIVAAVLGLISVIIAGLARVRSVDRNGTGFGRLGAIVALLVGLIATVLSGLHLAWSAGGIGTGNGRLGAIVALVLGLIGMLLGSLALARSSRSATAQ